jgi:hypothetical protein
MVAMSGPHADNIPATARIPSAKANFFIRTYLLFRSNSQYPSQRN